MAIRLPEREGKPDSTTGFYPVGFDDDFLGSASENSGRPARLAAISKA
jgi:hypothetical protein